MNKSRLLANSTRSRRGMSLTEIMVVIAIIGIVGSVIAVNVFSFLDDAAVDGTKIQIRNMEKGLIAYAAKHKGKFPSSSEGLEAAKKYFGDNGQVPVDQWGNAFIYSSPGSHGDHAYEIVSLGKDGKEGGEDANADIQSWNMDE
ncbi:MAG: type II secretion system protein GspG [Deltaproteobacteria bacterium]|nr:type II secretion system protein GspG [Deltaproteobacteria bacterium]